MAIAALDISDFRNLRRISLHCSPQLNLIIGENASGKTSLLEAIYFLGRIRSFRTRNSQELIYKESNRLRVVGRINSYQHERIIPIGVERNAQQFTARLDGKPVRSLAELAKQLPILLLNPDSHRLLEDGPQQRRSFMDWGLFHQETAFLPAWKRYRSALKQRNAGLRVNSTHRELEIWEQELQASSEVLDQLRERYCEALEKALTPLLAETLGQGQPRVDYRRGWNQERSLLELLHRDREQDRQQGYTRAGPHRADFNIAVKNQNVTEYLSRGQQKLLVIALVLAQAQLYREHCGTACILLVDDLPAELDSHHRERIMASLAAQDTQLFITAIEPGLLTATAWQPEQLQVFKLTHGSIAEMV